MSGQLIVVLGSIVGLTPPDTPLSAGTVMASPPEPLLDMGAPELVPPPEPLPPPEPELFDPTPPDAASSPSLVAVAPASLEEPVEPTPGFPPRSPVLFSVPPLAAHAVAKQAAVSARSDAQGTIRGVTMRQTVRAATPGTEDTVPPAGVMNSSA
jgi:hypothetical protein